MKMTFITERAKNRIARIEQLLQGDGMPVLEICAALCITPRWGREYIRYLREQKKVYIVSWTRTTDGKKDHPLAVYRWGDGKDKRRPRRKSGAQRQRETRERMVEDDLAHEVHKARRRAKRVKPSRDWTAAWILSKGE